MEDKSLIAAPGDGKAFFQQIADTLLNARAYVKHQVDSVMIVTYYDVGRMIIEREQSGNLRAKYGAKLLSRLADYLTQNVDRRYTADNLKLMRRFYVVYSEASIGESAIPQFTPNVSWTNYIQLMRVKNAEARRFYEIETADNDWTIRELQRQINSSLYERLALQRGKDEIQQLAREGHVVKNQHDIFKDPFVLEFTGLDESAGYSESQLERGGSDE
jgi:hypothetical protein